MEGTAGAVAFDAAPQSNLEDLLSGTGQQKWSCSWLLLLFYFCVVSLAYSSLLKEIMF